MATSMRNTQTLIEKIQALPAERIAENVANTPQHERALRAIEAAHQAGRALWISRQVLRWSRTSPLPGPNESMIRSSVASIC